MAGCVSYTDRDYRDYLAAKNDNIREEIAADNRPSELSPKLKEEALRIGRELDKEYSDKAVSADFAKRNADLRVMVDTLRKQDTELKDFIAQSKEESKKQDVEIAACRVITEALLAHDSDGFYARVPQLGRAEGFVISERDRLLQIIRQLTDLLAKR